MKNFKGVFTVGITGASGAIYGVRLVQELLRQSYKVHLIVTESGWQVFREELGFSIDDREAVLNQLFDSTEPDQLLYHTLQDFTAPIASGSYQNNGMIVIPCSMGTMAGIALGTSKNLLERTADVMLKEGRSLIIVPRETPLNQIHLENMLQLSKVGAKILPAMPAFYQLPKTMDDLIHFVVGKALDSLGVSHQLFTRWGEKREH